MSQDHYAILGVTPTAQPTVIRAAYLALMREYHPDRNASPMAAERAQAIVAAYKVLGDFDRRQEYDWDRRRVREAAVAIAARPKRTLPAAVVVAAGLGLAVVGAVMMRPGATAVMPPDRLADVGTEVAKTLKRSVPQAPPPVIELAERAPVVMPVPKVEPVELVSELYPAPLPEPVTAKRAVTKVVEAKVGARAPVEKVAAVQPPPKAVATVAAVVPKPMARLAAKPVAVAKPVTAGDLASLDQFVMSFYGQSWRYGDARKRAALEQSRSLFVVRRAACAADSCKRSEMLRLQREVSAIVASEPLR
ncbi:DnaJ domain-containing protein [Sphingomonas sp.]|uniref:DnaJ domain-containing protein n=1 Tax=Sphingomonas sp. TaxID=28214 RepID=UPI00286B3909|nr:DnaJ domain-containing protein [Sphingomonas sp.]